MTSFEHALPAESIAITPIDPNGRYLLLVKIADDLNAAEFQEQVLSAFRKLGVATAQVAFVYIQGTAVVYTHEVKPPEPERRSHRG